MSDEEKRPLSKKINSQLSNSKPRDSSSKLIFGNAELCSQFLRNYMDMPILKNIRAEDIEDVTERYVPMFTEERNSDTVKRTKLSENNTLFIVSVIEHKTKVDYNVSMQLLRYMVYIWEDYEKEMERQHKGISKTKGFKYPPVLPIVYYEGTGKWTAARNLRDRILFDNAFEPFTPRFFYKLIELNSYSIGQLVEKNDELLDIIARVTSSMLRHLNLPEDEVAEFTEQVKERKMAELFENFKDVDIPAVREKAMKKGMTKGWKQGLEQGLAEGEARLAKLVQTLIQSNRMDDLTRALDDLAHREELYKQYDI